MASLTNDDDIEESVQDDDTNKKVQSRNLKSGRLLGKGLSSIVYETTWKGKSYARKDFLRVPSDIFEREATVLVGLDHPNLVRTYCWTVDEGSCSLVVDLMNDNLLNLMRKRKASQRKQFPGSGPSDASQTSHLIDLHKFIEDGKNAPVGTASESVASTFVYCFSMPEALHIMLEIAEGIVFLHDNGVAHGDLKPKNILVTPSEKAISGSLDQNVAFKLKVADFGLNMTKIKSKTLVSRQARRLEMVRWRAPELLDMIPLIEGDHESSTDSSDWDSDSSDGKIGGRIHEFSYGKLGRADVYSFALTCSQILTGEDPYPGLGLNDLVRRIPLGFRPGLPHRCPAQLRDLINRCWGEELKRPTFIDILSELKELQAQLTASPMLEPYLLCHDMAALHLEFSLGSRRSTLACVPFGVLSFDGRHNLCETEPTKLLGIEGYTKLKRSQLVRLPREIGQLFSDFRGTKKILQVLKDICLVASFSEEFFLSVSKDQRLTTAIICDKEDPSALFSSEVVKIKNLEPSFPNALFSDSVSITIHSNVVPRRQVVSDEAPEVAGKRLCFPSTFLDVALSENKPLVEQLGEWEEEQWHERDDDGKSDQHKDGTPFWNVESGDVVIVKNDFGKGGQAVIGKILWRAGIFARKVFNLKEEFYTELEVVRQVSHPHIVYSFGLSISTDEKKQEHEHWYNRPFVSKKKNKRKQEHDEKQDVQHSLLMELLDGDLFLLIRDRVRLEGRSKPPFSRPDSVHILLQVAKAIAYMHDLAEPVIHGDLKSENILVSQCEILGDVCDYFVKVADFGSAKILNSSCTFKPNKGTTKYAAPEVLVARSEELVISCPQKIDVYSFGIIAFEVLTGLEPYKKSLSVLVTKEGVTGLVPYEGVSNPSELKKGVIAGTLRPPLHEACIRPNFWSDRPDLIALVERCWHPEPSARPHFSEVAYRLESIYNDLV